MDSLLSRLDHKLDNQLSIEAEIRDLLKELVGLLIDERERRV